MLGFLNTKSNFLKFDIEKRYNAIKLHTIHDWKEQHVPLDVIKGRIIENYPEELNRLGIENISDLDPLDVSALISDLDTCLRYAYQYYNSLAISWPLYEDLVYNPYKWYCVTEKILLKKKLLSIKNFSNKIFLTIKNLLIKKEQLKLIMIITSKILQMHLCL